MIDQARKPATFLLGAALLLTVSALFLAQPASAATGTPLGGTCDARGSQPFLPWLDPFARQY